MKFVIGLLIVGIAGGVFFLSQKTNLKQQNVREGLESGQLPARKSTSKSGLTIEELRQIGFDSNIQVVRKVRETDKFVSYVVEFVSQNFKQFALLNIPTSPRPIQGYPVVIVNHGYIPPKEFSTENSYINTSAYFASNGFLVLKPDYRGHGISEGTAEGLKDRIGYSIDVLNLISGIKNLADADSENIFMYGHSMGGEVSLRTIIVCGDCVKAVSFWAPAVTNWPESSFYFSKSNDPARYEKLMKEFTSTFSSEEVNLVSTWENINQVKIPVIIHHGTNDESVPYSWGEDLQNRFAEYGINSQLFTYEGDNHDIARNWSRALARDIEFFRRQIK